MFLSGKTGTLYIREDRMWRRLAEDMALGWQLADPESMEWLRDRLFGHRPPCDTADAIALLASAHEQRLQPEKSK